MKNPWRGSSKVNPQKENGHREIANDCFQALIKAKLSGAVYQIILTVIDKTWGYGKHDAPVSLGVFQDSTGLSRQGVISAIKEAERLRIIIVSREEKAGSKYMINKHWDTWLSSQPQLTSKPTKVVNHALLDQSTTVDQTSQPQLTTASQVVTPATEPIKKGKETIKETIKESALKKRRFFFDNILLQEQEYKALVAKFGEVSTQSRLESLSLYKQSKGKRYKSDYATVLAWELRRRKEVESGTYQGKSQGSLRERNSYTKPPGYQATP